MVVKDNQYSVCEACKFKYKDKSWAEKCQKWCKVNYNLKITKHAIMKE